MVDTHHDERIPARAHARASGQSQNRADGVTAAASDSAVDHTVGTGVSDPEYDPAADPPDRPESGVTDFAVTPVAGTLLTVVGLGVGLVAGFDIYSPRSGLVGSLGRAAVVLGYVVAGLLGTLWILDDANYHRERAVEWAPNPWAYLAGGALTVGAAICWWLRDGLALETSAAPAIAGIALVATCLASVAAGPIYLFRRHRKLTGR
jgi:hypothetical protein